MRFYGTNKKQMPGVEPEVVMARAIFGNQSTKRFTHSFGPCAKTAGDAEAAVDGCHCKDP